MTVTKSCSRCGREITRSKSQFRSDKVYCSRVCSNISNKRIGEKSSNWKGGTYLERGYRFIQTEVGQYVQEHRLVMEKELGRPLESWEIVHHIDGNKLNNEPDNLVVTRQADHARHHCLDRPINGLPRSDWSKRESGGCLGCGRSDILHYGHGMCESCWNKARRIKSGNPR